MPGRPRTYGKRIMITLMLEPEIINELDNIAEESGVSRNALIRNMIINSDKESIAKFSKEILELRKALNNLSNENIKLRNMVSNFANIDKFYTNIKPDKYVYKAFENIKHVIDNRIKDIKNTDYLYGIIDGLSLVLEREYEKVILENGKIIRNRIIARSVCKKVIYEYLNNKGLI